MTNALGSYLKIDWTALKIDHIDEIYSIDKIDLAGSTTSITVSPPFSAGTIWTVESEQLWAQTYRVLSGSTVAQRCRMHKTGNVLNYLPRTVQPKAKTALQDIWMAETRAAAHQAFDQFLTTTVRSTRRRPTVCSRIARPCWPSTTFPAERWIHLRTTNPIRIGHHPAAVAYHRPGCLGREARPDRSGQRVTRYERDGLR